MTERQDARERMIQTQIVARGIQDPQVLEALRKVPRHRFVPSYLQGEAYEDTPLPIGHGQTISQPYIVALMTELLALPDDARVLEIGTGSGYQTAILAEIAAEVYTIEIIPELADAASRRLRQLGYLHVFTRCGDGHRGWPEAAPFDGIIVTAAPRELPSALPEQLKVGGRLVIPVGDYYQDLLVVHRTAHGLERESITAVRFVPMTRREASDNDENALDSEVVF